MIDTSIHKLIFIFSTEYFTSKIIDVCGHDKTLLNNICMDYTKSIIDYKNDYYLHANFSSKGISHIKDKFFNDITLYLEDFEVSILELSFKSLQINHQNTLKRREKSALNNYIDLLTEEIYLYFLDNENLKRSYLDKYNIENFISEKYLEVSVESWLNSDNEADKYIAKIMHETNEAVFYYYLDMIDVPFFKLYPYTLMKETTQKNIVFYDSILKHLPKDNFYKSEMFIRNFLFKKLNSNNH